MKLQRLLFAVLIFYAVYQLRFPLETGIPSVNLLNILFGLLLAVVLTQKDVPEVVTHHASLKGAITFFFLALTLAFVISLARGGMHSSMEVATYYKNALFFPLFYFLALRSRLNAAHTRQLVILILAIAALGSLQAVRQGLDYGLGSYVDTRRASGPFGVDWKMANRAGVYFAMYVPMFAALAIMMKGQKLWRIAAIAGVALATLAVMFTYSRQSYGIALIGFALILLRRNVLLAMVVFISLVSLTTYLPDSVTDRVAETRQRDASGGEEVDLSTASRWIIWEGGLQMLSEYPMGVGLTRFPEHIGNYAPQFPGKDAHNFYVLTLCECGFIGLSALLWLMLRIFLLSMQLRRMATPGDDEMRALTIGFSVMVPCMAMGNLYGSPFFEGAIMGVFWLLCGFLERYAVLRAHGAGETHSEVPTPITAEMAQRFPLATRAARGGHADFNKGLTGRKSG